MRNRLGLIIAATVLLGGTATAFADDASVLTGTAGGAATGAVVGGPVGAAVGGVIGAVVGASVDPPPPQVVAYVQEQPPPPPVVLQGNLVVGATLPRDIELYPVPPNVYPEGPRGYGYAIVNGHTVIVDPSTGVVIDIVG